MNQPNRFLRPVHRIQLLTSMFKCKPVFFAVRCNYVRHFIICYEHYLYVLISSPFFLNNKDTRHYKPNMLNDIV